MLLDELVVQMKVNGDTKPIERAISLLEQTQMAYQKILGNPKLDFMGSEPVKTLERAQKKLDELTEKVNEKRVIRLEVESNASMLQQTQDTKNYLKEMLKEYELNERYGIKLANGKKVRLNLDAAIARSTEGATNKVAALKQELMGLAYANPVLSRLIGSFGMFAAMTGASIGLQQYIAISDQWKTIGGQIKNVSKSIEEAEKSELELYNIASRTRQSYTSTAELYTSVSRNASELGKDSGEILKFTEDVSNAMLLGGSSAQAQAAALVQLGQALGSGVLRGDELNSILEQAPRLAKAIASGMDTTVGNLRALGAKGEITSQKLFEAIRKQSETLKKELGNTPWTVEQAKTKVQNSLGMLFYTIEKKLGIGSKIAQGIAKVSEMLEHVNNILAATPTEKIVSALQAMALYAGVFYVYTKRTAIVNTFMAGAGAVRMLATEFKNATTILGGLRAMIAAIGATGAASSVMATGGLILIVALIVVIILIIQDLYVWIKGGKSVFGEWFGSWDDVVEKVRKKWKEVCEECSKWIKKHWTDALMDVLNLLFEIWKYVTPIGWAFQGLQYLSNKFPANEPLYKGNAGKKPLIEMFTASDFRNGPDVNPAALGAIGRYGGTGNNVTNSGNVTYYNNYNIKSSTPEAVAREIGDSAFPNIKPPTLVEEWGP